MLKISERYKIRIPIIAIVEVGGLHTSLFTVPGDIVTIIGGPIDGLRMVEVKWRDTTALMFTMELRDHADLISESASGSRRKP